MAKPTDEELEICAYFQNIIKKADLPINYLRFKKKSDKYVHVTYYYDVFKFRITEKTNQIILDRKYLSECQTNLFQESCKDENLIKVEFVRPTDLMEIEKGLILNYKNGIKTLNDFFMPEDFDNVEEQMDSWHCISLNEDEVLKYLREIDNKICNNLYIDYKEQQRTKVEEENKRKELMKKEKLEQKFKKEELLKLQKEQNTDSAQNGKPVIQFDDNMNEINRFESITIVSKAIGINSKSIRECCKGRQIHAGGFM